ncbi:MAG: hypothetical protein LBJ97_03300 [Mycoplasmataceae bacterium]|nr:hypothetical protein [Mycoplasmataceae bacterium]
MGKREIYKVLAMTLDEFTDEIEIIRQICQEYNADQINDDKNDTIMFNFYDSKSWKSAKEKIQLTVDNVIFKSSSKYVNIEKQMKPPIIDPTPPTWFTNFKSEMLEFKDDMLVFKNEMLKFKNEMIEFKNEMLEFKKEMLEFKKEMREFQKLVFVRFEQLDTKIDNVNERLTRVIKLNNLKE